MHRYTERGLPLSTVPTAWSRNRRCGFANFYFSGNRCVKEALQRSCFGQMRDWEGSIRPKFDSILESSLYVSAVPRSGRSYEETFEFRVISEFGERGCAMHVGPRQVLLLFKKGASLATQSPHDGAANCTSHSLSLLPNWPAGESSLQSREIAVEEKRTWELGGWSLYFRDPDRHLIELVTPGTWSDY
jgi:catechol 2,3-dioxygenase-like lactoylglutathione lyase family enzyme